MDLSLSAEQEDLRSSVRSFCRKELVNGPPADADGTGQGGPLWQKVADLGWLGVLAPQELHGVGGSLLEAAIILEEFGRFSVRVPFLPCAIVAVAALNYLPPQPIRDQLLADIS